MSNGLMFINKRRGRRSGRRVRHRNPILNFSRAKRSSSGSGNLLADVGITAVGVISNLIIPSKVMGLTGVKKYLAQAGMAVLTATIIKGIVGGRVAGRLSLGQGVALVVSVANDLILAKQGKEVLSADENEIPVLSAEYLPEIQAEGETVIIPEEMSALEPGISAIEPEISAEESVADDGEEIS